MTPVISLTLFSVSLLKRSCCFFWKVRHCMFLGLCPRSVSKCHVKVKWLFSCSDKKMSHCDKDLYAFPFAMSDYLLIKAWTSWVTPFHLLSIIPALSAWKCFNSFIKIFSFSKQTAVTCTACHRPHCWRLSLGRGCLSLPPACEEPGAGTPAGCPVCHVQGGGYGETSQAGRDANVSSLVLFGSSSYAEILAHMWIFKID